jgi:hypothetical protein
MSKHPSMTDEQKQLAIALRADGLPYIKIAAKIGVSETCAYKFLVSLSKPPAPKPSNPKQKPNRKKPQAASREFHHVGSIPMRRHINPELRNVPPLTREQMYYDLARKVRNTARLSA